MRTYVQLAGDTCTRIEGQKIRLYNNASWLEPERRSDNDLLTQRHEHLPPRRLIPSCSHLISTTSLRRCSPTLHLLSASSHVAIMPKNKGKGGKNRRRGKNDNEDDKRELIFKEDGQGT